MFASPTARKKSSCSGCTDMASRWYECQRMISTKRRWLRRDRSVSSRMITAPIARCTAASVALRTTLSRAAFGVSSLHSSTPCTNFAHWGRTSRLPASMNMRLTYTSTVPRALTSGVRRSVTASTPRTRPRALPSGADTSSHSNGSSTAKTWSEYSAVNFCSQNRM